MNIQTINNKNVIVKHEGNKDEMQKLWNIYKTKSKHSLVMTKGVPEGFENAGWAKEKWAIICEL